MVMELVQVLFSLLKSTKKLTPVWQADVQSLFNQARD
jgi:hypothetical protein